MTELTREPLELEIPTGQDTRLLVRVHTTPTGREVVAVLPQRMGRDGSWVLQHSGLTPSPDVARELADALVTIATIVETDHEGGTA